MLVSVLRWCKMQIMCLLILAYIGIVFIKEGKNLKTKTQKSNCNPIFDLLFLMAESAVFFDGLTACTVNFTGQIPRTVNLLAHLGMLVSYEIFAALLFWYWVSVTVGIPKRKWAKAAYLFPSMISVCLTALFLPELRFIEGKYTCYSMGISAYICYGSIAVYCGLIIALMMTKHRYISQNKRVSLAVTLVFIVIVVSLQIMFPESLVSCIALMMVIISIYLNMENPAIRNLEYYHHEMVMGFATLVENKDDNTGGHIRRTSAYAVLIAENLRKNSKYKNLITKDYIDNLAQSAPMHDVGKIGIPDAILQKSGKLTAEEFDTMKKHPMIGGKIIKDTFGHLFNGEYENMAFQVARYHHEKWNGKGYPEGLKGPDIPLCARIMSVADVFDAVSAKRCYKDALSPAECYQIVLNGRCTDFDPDIVDAFLMDKDKIEEIYYNKIQ